MAQIFFNNLWAGEPSISSKQNKNMGLSVHTCWIRTWTLQSTGFQNQVWTLQPNVFVFFKHSYFCARNSHDITLGPLKFPSMISHESSWSSLKIKFVLFHICFNFLNVFISFLFLCLGLLFLNGSQFSSWFWCLLWFLLLDMFCVSILGFGFAQNMFGLFFCKLFLRKLSNCGLRYVFLSFF